MTTDTDQATVLIVEDEQDLADLYAQFLEPAYTVLTAYNGQEALDIIDHTIDVVLLDRRMPGLSGEEVLRAIRNKGYDCRVAMVTAVTPDIDIIEMGFDDYLTKPVRKAELREAVEHLLELDAYNDLMEKYYQLTRKKVALEVEKTDTQLSELEEFNQLTDRLDDIKDELRAKEEQTSEFDLRSLLDRSRTHIPDE